MSKKEKYRELYIMWSHFKKTMENVGNYVCVCKYIWLVWVWLYDHEEKGGLINIIFLT